VRNYAAAGHVVFAATGGGRQFWYGNTPYATASTIENPDVPSELRAKLFALGRVLRWPSRAPVKR
jgi:hypothetical protein